MYKVLEAKSYRDILKPVMDDLINERVVVNEKDISMLELMSSDAICQLFLDAIDFYMDCCKHHKLRDSIDKIENRRKQWKYPKKLIDNVKYLEYIQTQSKRPDMTKTESQIEEVAKANMIIHCFNFQLGVDGTNMKLR